MTKSQIKAELRRSAMEDDSPWYECSDEAFEAVFEFKDLGWYFTELTDMRTFFLLVAEAL